MPTLVIVGAQWGDEAKGKLVDVLGGEAHVVVRYSGGNNAGHTVKVGEDEFKFHLIPAGILHPHVTAVLGGGMVVCPKSLLEEMEATRAKRSEIGALVISRCAHVVFPYHRILDALEEEARGANKIGTTSRGIGPAYQDKVGRFGIRVGELIRPNVFRERLREVLEYKNRLISMLGGQPLDFDELYSEYSGYAQRIAPMVGDAEGLIHSATREGKRVLFEGAQGTFLDLDAGTYPFVTSSHPISGGACLGTGIGPRDIDRVIGVCKAYTTRVGAGPFPTELDDATGEAIRAKGNEYGTTTGRGRRCGWLDLNLLRRSAQVNSLSGLVVTRLDVLSGLDTLQVAVGYRLGAQLVRTFPVDTCDLAAAEPEYVELPGWREEVRSARAWDELPEAARRYLTLIETETGVPIAAVSVGPDRAETIRRREELFWG